MLLLSTHNNVIGSVLTHMNLKNLLTTHWGLLASDLPIQQSHLELISGRKDFLCRLSILLLYFFKIIICMYISIIYFFIMNELFSFINCVNVDLFISVFISDFLFCLFFGQLQVASQERYDAVWFMSFVLGGFPGHGCVHCR